MFEVLNETYIKENIKVFDIIKVNEFYLSPYNFEKYLKKNISYNDFTIFCLNLSNYSILKQELEYLKKYYSKKIIKNNKRLLYYINNLHIIKYKKLNSNE